MAKRSTGLRKVTTSRSKKTKKRIATKHAMLEARTNKKKRA